MIIAVNLNDPRNKPWKHLSHKTDTKCTQVWRVWSPGLSHHAVQWKFTDVLEEWQWTSTRHYSVTYQKIMLFIVTAVRTSNPTNLYLVNDINFTNSAINASNVHCLPTTEQDKTSQRAGNTADMWLQQKPCNNFCKGMDQELVILVSLWLLLHLSVTDSRELKWIPGTIHKVFFLLHWLK